MMKFSELNLNNNISEALKDINYKELTPIQEKVIPLVLQGKDVVACAETGTGKTASFAIPIINTIHKIVGSPKKRKQIRTLVLTPTRELAVQIAENFDTLSKYTAIKTLVIYGGVNQVPQVNTLKEGIDVLVATPGRFLDLYKQKHIVLDGLQNLVIDEADLMLDMGFINDVKKIIKLCHTNRQTLLFSATMPLQIRELADDFLNNAQYIQEAPKYTLQNITQKAYLVEKEHKRKLLRGVLEEHQLSDILIFTRTKQGATNVADFLNGINYKADAIHGDKAQSKRLEILQRFKNKELSILVATDVAARGLDIESLPYVINYDIPNIPEIYIHRIGRTARAGKTGVAISFVGRDEKKYFETIEKTLRTQIKVVKNHPYPWETPKEGIKKDYRNKKSTKSRKSENSKKNKKRWY